MKNNVDLSPEALGHYRELAQNATPGPWEPGCFEVLTAYQPAKKRVQDGRNDSFICLLDYGDDDYYRYIDRAECDANTKFIATMHPGVVTAMCYEIEQLRKDNAKLEQEADWLAEKLSDVRPKEWGGNTTQGWRGAARVATKEQ